MKAALHFLFGFLAFFAFSNMYFAQSLVTENQSYYKVISDPSEVQEIVKRCALESRCLDEYYKKPHPEDTKIDLPKLKQLLRDENPAIQAAGLNWIGVESWRTGEIYDQEVIALVKACLKNLSCYQQYAIRAIAIVDPANASNELLALLAKDSLNQEDRQSAKYALGELKASPESIQYFMGKLSQTKRSIFEQSDVQFEFNALCALYATASSDQQNEIFAFISDFVEKDSSYTLYPLIRAWLKNPAPALLPTMEALIWEELKDQRGYINESLAATVLSQKGKTGKKLAKEILGQDIAHYAMTVLPWAVQNGEGKMVEEIISRLASDSYFMKDLVDDLFEIGGRSLVDRFVEKVVDDEKRKFAKTYSTIQFDSLSPQHPMMRFNDTLVRLGLLKTGFSKTVLDSMRNHQPLNTENAYQWWMLRGLPEYIAPEAWTDNFFDDTNPSLERFLLNRMQTKLPGLEYLRYADVNLFNLEGRTYEWWYFDGKLYEWIQEDPEEEYDYQLRKKFNRFEFLLEMKGIQERYFEVPNNYEDYEGGFLTTPERAKAIFALLGLEMDQD